MITSNTPQSKIQLFNDKKVRTIWDNEKEEWFFSVIDVVDVLTNSADAKRYWSVLKLRLKKEGIEPTTICSKLKLPATDGKMRLTDVATPKSFSQQKAVAKSGGNVAQTARAELESKLGRSIISNAKASDYLREPDSNKEIEQ